MVRDEVFRLQPTTSLQRPNALYNRLVVEKSQISICFQQLLKANEERIKQRRFKDQMVVVVDPFLIDHLTTTFLLQLSEKGTFQDNSYELCTNATIYVFALSDTTM